MSEAQPSGGGHVRRAAVIAALAGLALSAGIIVWVGFDKIARAFLSIGWHGLACMCLTYLPPVGVLALSWLVLDARARPIEWITLMFARLVRDASGELLPFSSLGGYVFGARAAILGGMDPAMAMSTTVVDATAEFISQLGFAALGFGLLLHHTRAALENDELVSSSLIGFAAGVVGVTAFVVFQRRLSGLIEREVAKRAPSALAQTSAVVESVHALFERPLRLILSTLFHFAGWVLGAVGVWAGLWLAGIHMSVRTIVGLESLVYVVRTVTFAAPMGLGVIETAYAVVGPMFGLDRDFAVALSLIKRLRDVAIGLPAMALWQALEGRQLMKPDQPKPLPAEAEQDQPAA
ncbi:MAG TPA: lysylphosphatidylglycerol synthase domain-containing protein [Caulobacteraceae bacterium]